MKRHMCLLAIFSMLAFYSQAQIADTLELDRIFITASKVETTERLTTKVVDVISLKEIQASGAKDLSQLLQQQNGLLINGANSNPGKDKAVYLRGAGTQYTVILIDGYPISDPSSEGGAFDLRLLPLSNVQRIEIVKGSMSTLYGSDAIAGVINIITKRPDDDTYSLVGGISFGSFNDQNYQLGVTGTLDGVGYSINGAIRDVDGLSDALQVMSPEDFDQPDFDNDGFTQHSLSTTLDIPISTDISFQPFVNLGDFDGKYDGGAFTDAPNSYDADFLNFGSRFKIQATDFNIRGAIAYTDTERSFRDAFGVFNPSAQLFNADVFGYYNLKGGNRIMLGLNHQNLGYQLNDAEADNSITSPYISAFINTEIGLGGEVGARINQHSEFGSNATFNIAPVYNVNESFKLLFSYSTGFKSPTLNELFGPFGANPDLKPQKSATIDLGGRLYLLDDMLEVQLTAFSRQVEDLILYAGFETGYINTDEQNDQGIEISARLTNRYFELSTYYNYLDGERKSAGGTDENLIRRPKHNLGLNLQRSFNNGLDISISGEYVGERNDLFFDPSTFVSSEVKLDSYTLINIRGSYQTRGVRLFGDLKNILDVDYFEVYGFSTPGMHFNVGVQFEL